MHFVFYIDFTEKFFEMPKKQAKDALDLYKKFLVRMERCAETLKVAEVSISVLRILSTFGIKFEF